MKIEKKTVLHVIDVYTRFSATHFKPRKILIRFGMPFYWAECCYTWEWRMLLRPIKVRHTFEKWKKLAGENVVIAGSFRDILIKAKENEIAGLLRRDAFKIVLREYVLPIANVLGGRFVLTIKNPGTNYQCTRPFRS